MASGRMADIQEDDTASMTGTPSDIDAVTELKQLCQDVWEVVKANNDEIYLKSDQNKPLTINNNSSALAKILHEKEKRLRSEIETLSVSRPSVLPNNPDILRAALFSDLKESLVQLDEVMTFVRSQGKELSMQLTREEGINRQLRSVSDCLEIKLDVIDNDNEQEVTMALVMQELDAKIQKAEVVNRKLTKKMITFVNLHFPLPSEDDVKAGEKKQKINDSRSSDGRLAPFRFLLQELMNKCFDEPHDPYVTISRRFWPPYVELLLRCQIVLRHPEDDQRIKLVPFHL